MRAFVTGASGFVGGFLTRHLREAGDEVEPMPDGIDITDTDALLGLLGRARPEVVYHLAALAHVGRSWTEPAETMRVNALGTLALLEAVRELPVRPRVLLVSSAEVYGAGDGAPLDEEAPLRPASPYAASKVAAEFIGLQAHLGRGLDVVRARPFNHVGAGQAETFVVSGLAKRIVAAERARAVRSRSATSRRRATSPTCATSCAPTACWRKRACPARSTTSPPATRSRSRRPARNDSSRSPSVPDRRRVEEPSLLRPVDVPLLVGDACAARRADRAGSRRWTLDETLASVLDVLAGVALNLSDHRARHRTATAWRPPGCSGGVGVTSVA